MNIHTGAKLKLNNGYIGTVTDVYTDPRQRFFRVIYNTYNDVNGDYYDVCWYNLDTLKRDRGWDRGPEIIANSVDLFLED